MKPLISSLMLAAAVCPLVTIAQDSSASQTVGTTPVKAATTALKKVAQPEMERTFTARDLIGKDVYNHAGERLGTINDVGLDQAWADRFGVAAAAKDETTPMRPDEPSDDGNGQLVYISTGGVLGLGGRFGVGADLLRANWVSVPADSLLFDRNRDRFILNIDQARFNRIAEATGAPATEEGAVASGIGGDGTAHPEVQRIEAALREDRDLRDRARIQVSHTGSAIQLQGEVDDAGLIRRAGDVAREHTELEVRNLIEVTRTAE